MTTPPDIAPRDELKRRALALQLHGLLAHWETLSDSQWPWLEALLGWEETERKRRSLERRLRNAHLGRFKPLADFDWDWPRQCDRAAVSQLMQLHFIDEAVNIILVGPNGVGKSTIAQNITHHAILHGHSALFVTAAQMLGDLTSRDGDLALRRRLKYYATPQLLVIDEVGYLAYGTRHADLLFNIVSSRYEKKPIIVTTNRPFGEWGDVFPNAACVVSIIDRLCHHAEILVLDGESYRMKEARERTTKKKKAARSRRNPRAAKPATTQPPSRSAP